MPKKKLTAAFLESVKSDKQTDYYDEVTSGLGLRVSPGGTKTFFYRYRYNGTNRRFTINRFSKTFTLSDARIEADTLRSRIRKGYDPVGEEKAAKRTKQLKAANEQTFKEMADEFKKIHLKALRKKTRDEHTRIIDNELLPAFGNFPAVELKRGHIISFLDKKAVTGGKPTMANRIRARLHSIFEFGIHRGIVEVNPVSGIKPYPEGETKRERYYSEKEIRLLWKAFEKLNEPARSVMKMLLVTGQRKTETMRMRWGDINGNLWTIPKEVAKGKRSHDVPLSDMALEILEQMKLLSGEKTYVFASPVLVDEPVSDIKRSVKSVRNFYDENDEDFIVSDFRLHDLRRTAATFMAKLNVERTTLGKILNHKGLAGDGQVTAIYDRHTYLKEKRIALQRWANHLDNIISGEKMKIHHIA